MQTTQQCIAFRENATKLCVVLQSCIDLRTWPVQKYHLHHQTQRIPWRCCVPKVPSLSLVQSADKLKSQDFTKSCQVFPSFRILLSSRWALFHNILRCNIDAFWLQFECLFSFQGSISKVADLHEACDELNVLSKQVWRVFHRVFCFSRTPGSSVRLADGKGQANTPKTRSPCFCTEHKRNVLHAHVRNSAQHARNILCILVEALNTRNSSCI